jgi:hypothetical protein
MEWCEDGPVGHPRVMELVAVWPVGHHMMLRCVAEGPVGHQLSCGGSLIGQ